MRYTKGFIGGSIIASIALAAAPVFASSGDDFTTLAPLPLIQVNESGFGSVDNTSSYLFKLGGNFGRASVDLFAVTENADGVQVWASGNNWSTEWTELENSKLETDSTATSVVGIRAYGHHLYVLLNSDTGFEVWTWNKQDGWVNSLDHSDAGAFGTAINIINGEITVASTSYVTGEAQLYATRDCISWEQISETGLGLDITAIVGLESFNGIGYAIADDNRLLSIDENNSVSEVADLSGEVLELTTIKAIGKDERVLLIGGRSDAGAVVLSSTDGVEWDTMVADGFGDSANSSITDFKLDKLRKSVQAYTQNANGFQVWETSSTGDYSTWALFRDEGAIDSDNTSVATAISYRGRVYTSTANAVDGTQVYLTQLRPSRPHVDFPAFGSMQVGSMVTVYGTAQAGDKISIRHRGHIVASATADENGYWSVELTDLSAGVHTYNVFARYQVDGEVAGKLSLATHIMFIVKL